MDKSNSSPERSAPEAEMIEPLPLLSQVLKNPLDIIYFSLGPVSPVARKHPWIDKFVVLLLAIILGLTMVWAVRLLRTPPDGGLTQHQILSQNIEERSATADTNADLNQQLQTEIAQLRENVIPGYQIDPNLELSLGVKKTSGPGIVITLNDAPEPGGALESNSENRVRDLDLRTIINELWRTGAEAISINGTRIGPGVTVRTAGEAILIDLSPTLAPYVISAIGDPVALQTAMLHSNTGDYLKVLEAAYGLSVSIEKTDKIVLEPRALSQLRYIELEGYTPVPAETNSEKEGG